MSYISPTTAPDPYAQITDFFNGHAGRLLEIEILPSSFTTTLIDGPNIGIPKGVLVAAFLAARKIFFDNYKCDIYDQPRLQLALEASRIVLCFDGEHLTAINFRKKGLLGQKQPSLQHITDELVLIESFLTSPLHRHTKSPTLWSHRRWLIELWQKTPKSGRGQSIMPSQFWDAMLPLEMRVVTRAGERHPKNYYAWSYARWLYKLHQRESGPEDPSQAHLPRLHQDILTWCLAHPSDVSGWSFLLFLLSEIPSKEAAAVLVDQLFAPSAAFCWSHEAMWACLRTALASDKILDHEPRELLLQRVVDRLGPRVGVVASHPDDDTSLGLAVQERETLAINKALGWINRCYHK
ncbi:MAG: hypothetical protein M1829_003765 [Trizodia sp. TS-e1964]|nr:MAG: hypothetical protein M1829_003765 [Trizodia sp. TS-e1964]